jgi:hypothetical protein
MNHVCRQEPFVEIPERLYRKSLICARLLGSTGVPLRILVGLILITISLPASNLEDSDNDQLPDDWEVEHFGNLSKTAEGDADNDGISNFQEYLLGSNPNAEPAPEFLSFVSAQSVPGQDFPATGSVTTQDEGRWVTITGNRWIRIPISYTVTPNTVIEFEFKGVKQGEVHGVGLDDDSNPVNTLRMFRVWGTDNWTVGYNPGDYDHYMHHNPNWAKYRIRVGQHYTGAMSYLVLANDHDLGTMDGSSEVRNVRVYEKKPIHDEGNLDLSVYGGYALSGDGDRPKQGVVNILDSGRELEMIGNRWLQVLVNYEVTPFTVVDFSYRSDVKGEIHGLGLDENSVLQDATRIFQLDGTQVLSNGISALPKYDEGGLWSSYRLEVGKSYTGLMRYLALANDHDVSTPTAHSSFREIRIYEAEDADDDGIPDWWETEYGLIPTVNDADLDPDEDGLTNLEEYLGSTNPMDPEGPLLLGGYLDFNTAQSVPGQDFPATGSINVTDGGRSLLISGNRWLRLPFTYEVTPNTVIEFEYKGIKEGEIHAVGLDEDTNPTNLPRLFRVWGTDNWSQGFNPGDYDHYKHHHPDWNKYRIRVGQHYTGTMHYVLVANDHDAAPQDAISEVRNIRIYESPLIDQDGMINLGVWSGYGIDIQGNDRPKEGTVSEHDGGKVVELLGNRWIKVRADQEVSSHTVIDFSYKREVQGEVHGLGLDENSTTGDAIRVFQFDGTQHWAGAINALPKPQRFIKPRSRSVGKRI